MFCLRSVQFSWVLWPNGWSMGHEGWFSRYPLPVFSAEGPCEQFWHGQGCPLFDVSIQYFLCRSRSHQPIKMPRRMVLEKPSWCVTCPNHASCVDKFPRALGFESLDLFSFFFRASKQSPCFTAIEENGGNKGLVQFEFACEVDGVAPPDPV